MTKRMNIGICVFLVLVFVICINLNAVVKQKRDITIKIGELKERLQEMAAEIEQNPETENVEKWKKLYKKTIMELEELMAMMEASVEEGRFPDIERAIKQSKINLQEYESAIDRMKKENESEAKISELRSRMAHEKRHLEELLKMLEQRRSSRTERRADVSREAQIQRIENAMQEYRGAIEHNPDSENVEKWKGKLRELEQELGTLLERKTDRQFRLEQINEQMIELRQALEQYPDAERADQWRDRLKELEQESKSLQRVDEVVRPRTDSGRFPEIEMAIRRTTEQLHELELYFEDLQNKKAGEEQIHEVETKLVQKRKQLAEYRALLEKRQRTAEQPSAYQRERGELTATVISSSENDVTAATEEGGRVMVLRVRNWIRVEGQRVENMEEKNFVKGLKKGEVIWVQYTEGEERGSYFILDIKRVK